MSQPTTDTVRRMGPADAQALMQGPVQGYTLRRQGREQVLVPTTFTMTSDPQPVFADEVPKVKGQVEVPLGLEVRYETRGLYGTLGGGRTGTTEDVIRRQEADRGADAPAPDHFDVVPDEEGAAFSLAATYGAEVTASVIVAGLTPSEIQERVQRALAAEFAAETTRALQVSAKAVMEEYVNVYAETYEPEQGGQVRRLVAAHVLNAEVWGFMARTPGSISTEACSSEVHFGA